MADMDPTETGGGSGGNESNRKCGMEMNYVKSINGLLAAKKIGWSLIAFMICVFSGISFWGVFFGIVVFCGLFLSIGLFSVFAFSRESKITRINIFLFDFAVSIIGTIAYFVVSMGAIFSLNPILIAAAVFGFIAMLSFGGSVYLNYKRWRENKSSGRSDNKAYDPNY